MNNVGIGTCSFEGVVIPENWFIIGCVFLGVSLIGNIIQYLKQTLQEKGEKR